MNWQDLINGSYEFLASPFMLLSIIKLYKDKQVKGISWVHVFYFTSWGYWNLYYYPHLNQKISFIGGIFVVIINTIWLLQIIYYLRKGK
jgi:hypothetical protein